MRAKTLPVAPLKYKPPFDSQETALAWVKQSHDVWRDWDKERKKAIHDAREDVGCTMEQIGAAAGLSASSVHRIVHEL